MPVRNAQGCEHGFDMDFSELVYLGDRADVTDYMEGHGWKTTALSARELMIKHGLAVPEHGDVAFAEIIYSTSTK